MTVTTSRGPRHHIPLFVVAGVTVLSLASCSSEGGNRTSKVGNDGVTRLDAEALESQLDTLPVADLTTAERDGLLQMREEEKLAHDVYVALGQTWDIKTFANISAAEQTHADAVRLLLDRYGIADPSAGKGAGQFTDPDLQQLYTDLTAEGDASLVAALTVGATIEDLDIGDLRQLATTAPDISLVYDNLERGSRNHLRAFAKQLDKNTASYSPVHIDQAEYDEIVSTRVERGPDS